MINFEDSEIKQILPTLLNKSPEVQAISYAISKQIKKIYTYAKNSIVYSGIDDLPEQILDLLAIELRTQYYDESMKIENKRDLIKKTLAWYMKAGTPSAVEELVIAVFGKGKVTEWYDFKEGEQIPGTFDVETVQKLTPETIDQFRKMIKNVKNTRSHLRAIKITRKINNNILFGNGESFDSQVIIR